MLTGAPDKPVRVDAVLAEYEAHRLEVLAEAQAQQQTLALGATAVGLAVAGGFNIWDNRPLASVAFLGLVPLLCLFILVQWVGRAVGLLQVGVYLQQLEDAFRTAFPDAPPGVFVWERTLAGATERRGKKAFEPRYVWQDFAAIAIFAVLAYGSIALGSYRIYSGHRFVGIGASAGEVLLLTSWLHASYTTCRRRGNDCDRASWRRAQTRRPTYSWAGVGTLATPSDVVEFRLGPDMRKRFPFRFDPAYRRLARLFRVTPERAWVEVGEDEFVARFGPWCVRTPIGNIARAEVTGPYAFLKTAGPARLAITNRGLTFASNRDRGVCITFDTPVRGIDRSGRIRHPELTVTVLDVDGLVEALAPRER